MLTHGSHTGEYETSNSGQHCNGYTMKTTGWHRRKA